MPSLSLPTGAMLLLVAGARLGSAQFDPLHYVNPLVGAANGGNVFPGATLPYGMAKAVADTNSSSNQGGFSLDGKSFVTGFSAMHDSGVGSTPSLGTFPLFGYAGCKGGDVDNCAFPKRSRVAFGGFKLKNVSATPGYFGIRLDSGVKVDMTTTQRTALFRFAFPAKAPDGRPSEPLIFQDLSDLSDSRQDNGTITVDVPTGRIFGNARFQPSFGQGSYISYFCTDFKGAEMLDSGIWVDSRASNKVKTLGVSRGINGYPLPAGAYVRFKNADKPILARTATSFISTDQACRNAEQEMPKFDFESAQEAAVAAWRKKLSVVNVDSVGIDQSHVTNFYSGIYRTMISPQNYTGENPLYGEGNGEPYFDSFYCLWDSFRSQIPFLTVVDPPAVAQIIRSLIDVWRHVGWLPDCRMSLCKGYTQGGSNADNVLADAYVKGIKEGIDWNAGYDAVVKDAEEEPYDWSIEGRGGLDSWKDLGYIPVQDFDYKGFGTLTRSVSRTLEYSYNDFCVSQIAGGLDRQQDKEKYRGRSGNWQALFKKDQTSKFDNGTDTGFKGFFQPKFMNQTFGYQNPLNCSNISKNGGSCSLQNNGQETYESSLWEYGFFVPHDQAKLVATYGGPSEFVRRLDFLHDRNITYIGNEPSFLTVYQYHYAGRPGLSAKRCHFYIPRFFTPTTGGLPGNDDGGAMGSFVAFGMLGLFPNAGQDVYLITPPFFRAVNVTNPETGKTARIKTVGFDAEYKNIYVQSAKLDGKPYNKNWIGHSFFTEGRELELTLGPRESKWGTRVEDLPPSLSQYTGFGGQQERSLGGDEVRGGNYRSEFARFAAGSGL
ncbi:hypothetical protein MCOR32_010548 [Pyricularia oryzae]|nr:hypothetical protein MCOR32_010548 [Pyricularia oryzae]